MNDHSVQRHVRAESGYDVLIAGGGPAGGAAAICAARLGIKVRVLEATGASVAWGDPDWLRRSITSPA